MIQPNQEGNNEAGHSEIFLALLSSKEFLKNLNKGVKGGRVPRARSMFSPGTNSEDGGAAAATSTSTASQGTAIVIDDDDCVFIPTGLSAADNCIKLNIKVHCSKYFFEFKTGAFN